MPAEAISPPGAGSRSSKSGAATKAIDVSKSTVTRASLTRSVQKAIGATRAEASTYVAEVLGEIFERLIAREEVKLSSFGSFIVREKRARAGRNPKTGAAALITARLVVIFRPSPVMRARLDANSNQGGQRKPRAR